MKSMNIEPLVSIIIPTYNRETLISETLDSVINQTYRNWECIVVDDGSTDDTIQVVNQFASKDSRIKLIQRDRVPKGANTCRNIGFSKSKGEFVNWFDSDDIMLTDFISIKTRYLLENSNYDMVVCKGINFTSEFKYEYQRKYKLNSDNLLIDFMQYKVKFFTGGPLFRKKFLVSCPELFKEGQLKHQETEFYFRLLVKLKNRYGIINEALFKIRTHENSITKSIGWQDDLKISSNIIIDRYLLLKSNNLLTKKELQYFEKMFFENINSYFQLKYYGKEEKQKYKENIKYLMEVINNLNLNLISTTSKIIIFYLERLKGYVKHSIKKAIRYK